MSTRPDHLTLGVAATRIGGGVQHHHLYRLARKGKIPFVRAGRVRLVAVADLPRIRAVCEQLGYHTPIGVPTCRQADTPAGEVACA
jgi:hypothetical protein